jgi:hypothetical protein
MRRVVLRGLRDAAGALGRAVAGDEYAHDVRAGLGSSVEARAQNAPAHRGCADVTTGVVDAVSYLGLGRVFTGLQTGNVVVPGFALAGTEGFSAAPPGGIPRQFLRRCVAGRQIGRSSEPSPPPVVFSCAVDRSAAGGRCRGSRRRAANRRRDGPTPAGHRVAGRRDGSPQRHGTPLAVPEVTTTVVTSTITALAADSAVPGAGVTRGLWQLAAIAIRLVGAVAGALLVRVSLFLPFVLVASLIAVAAGAYLAPVVVRERRRSRSPGPPASGS